MGSADAAQTLLQLGMALGAVGAHQRAGDAFARALRVNERLFGKGSNQAADCIQGLASALLGQVKWMPCAIVRDIFVLPTVRHFSPSCVCVCVYVVECICFCSADVSNHAAFV